jgi:hypothetical protein
MGQHYVIDAILGAAYAAAGYLLVVHLVPAIGRKVHVQRPFAFTPVATIRPEMDEVWVDD